MTAILSINGTDIRFPADGVATTVFNELVQEIRRGAELYSFETASSVEGSEHVIVALTPGITPVLRFVD